MMHLYLVLFYGIVGHTIGTQVMVSIQSEKIIFADCNDCQLIAIPGICLITQELTADELATTVANAANTNTPPFTFQQLIICCDATSTPALLLDVLRYSTIEEITMDKCTQDFSPSIADFVVIYGLQRVTIFSDTSTDYPRNRIDLTQTDESDLTTTYQNYHIVFLHQNLFDGSHGIRGLSWTLDHTSSNLPAEITTALQRAPSTVTSKGDNTFMATAIYGRQ